MLLPGNRVFNSTGAPPNFGNNQLTNRSYRIKMMRNFGTFTTSASVATTLGVLVEVGGFNNASSLAVIFDQYRVVEAEFWIMPRASVSSIDASSAGANPGRMLSVVDTSDSGSIASEPDALDYSTVMMSSGVDGHYRRWVPRLAIDTTANAGASTATVVGASGTWIDSADLTVDHYGVKLYSSITSAVQVYDLYLRVTVEWRNTF
jgi:hypothetical protein